MNLFYLFVALSGLLITILAFNVSRVRIKEKIRYGEGGNKDLRNAIRAHSNSLEHMLPFALMLLVLQQQNTGYFVMQILVYGFLTIRLSHALGIIFSKFRVWQMSAVLSIAFSITAIIMILENLFK